MNVFVIYISPSKFLNGDIICLAPATVFGLNCTFKTCVPAGGNIHSS